MRSPRTWLLACFAALLAAACGGSSDSGVTILVSREFGETHLQPPKDATADKRFDMMQTMNRLGIRSFLCVPFKAHDGRTLGVSLIKRLRDERKFGSLDELVGQIRRDIAEARRALAS